MDPIVDNRNPRANARASFEDPVTLTHPIDPYPRNRAGIVRAYIGKKVTISTVDFHYVVGRVRALGADDVLILDVGAQTLALPRRSLATIQEADPALAEYVK